MDELTSTKYALASRLQKAIVPYNQEFPHAPFAAASSSAASASAASASVAPTWPIQSNIFPGVGFAPGLLGFQSLKRPEPYRGAPIRRNREAVDRDARNLDLSGLGEETSVYEMLRRWVYQGQQQQQQQQQAAAANNSSMILPELVEDSSAVSYPTALVATSPSVTNRRKRKETIASIRVTTEPSKLLEEHLAHFRQVRKTWVTHHKQREQMYLPRLKVLFKKAATTAQASTSLSYNFSAYQNTQQ